MNVGDQKNKKASNEYFGEFRLCTRKAYVSFIFVGGGHNWSFCPWPDALLPLVNSAERAGVAIKCLVGEKDPHYEINNGADWPRVRRFYDILAAQGVTDYDAIGLSFYPMWGAKLPKLRQVLDNAAAHFNKDIIIAETSFPWGPGKFPEKWKAAYRDDMEFPLTPEGQRQYTEALVREVKRTPGGHGRGIFWWGTEYLAPSEKIKGVSSDARNHVALFDDQANALPALEALGKASQ